MDRVVKNTPATSLKEVNSKTIKSFVENMYDIIRDESKGHLSANDLNTLRHSVFLDRKLNYDAPIFQRALEKGNQRMAESNLPVLMINKLNMDALEVIFFEMKEYFKCNSFSKLMKYLAITNSFMVNEYIKNRTASKLCLQLANT